MMAPHIVWVVADDLGFADVPFTLTNSEIHAPALTHLAGSGLVLDSYYVQPLCTPTRAAFMTGRHPVQLGLQHGVIRDAVPDGVPLNETMLPQLLRAGGYATHMVGKWHLGFYDARYTPEARGFDTVFGYYTGNAEYWNHTSPCWSCGNYTALDLHRAYAGGGWAAVTDAGDVYSTELFGAEAVAIVQRHAAALADGRSSSPLFLYVAFEAVHGASSCFVCGADADCAHPDGDELQAPAAYEATQAHIAAARRRRYAAMVGALDAAVANLTAALEAAAMGEASLLLFTTDNGAPFTHLGGDVMSNFPLRGGKGQVWEGGVRGAAFLWGGALPPSARGQRSAALLHATDWLPTMLRVAAISPPSCVTSGLYGVDAWDALALGSAAPRYSVRSELLHNLDPVEGSEAVRVGDFKLLRGVPTAGWGGDPRGFSPGGDLWAPTAQSTGDSAGSATPVVSTSGPDGVGEWVRALRDASATEELYNVVVDPEERHNLAGLPAYAHALRSLRERLDQLHRLAVPARLPPPDPAARPTPISGLHLCTPSPAGPILCDEPIGVWRPWREPPIEEQADGWERGLLPMVLAGAAIAAAAVAAHGAVRQRRAKSRSCESSATAHTARPGCWASTDAPSAVDLMRRQRDNDDNGDAGGGDRAGIQLAEEPNDAEEDDDVPVLLGLARVVTRQRRSYSPSPPWESASVAAGKCRCDALCQLRVAGAAAAAFAAATLWLFLGGWLPPSARADAGVVLCNASDVERLNLSDLVLPSTSSPATAVATSGPRNAPNDIVLFLTDDQDQLLGGGLEWETEGQAAASPLQRTRALLAGHGAVATNFFAHTPICCPSRSQILTGRYLHSIKVVPTDGGVAPGESCMHVNHSLVASGSFSPRLKALGYTVGLFGKYLNGWPGKGETASGVMPDGFDAWFANDGGSYIAPQFDAAKMHFAGIANGSWQGTVDDYTTAVVGNLSVQWIQSVAQPARGSRPPFFAYIAPKAVHEPFVPAPWHLDVWPASWPTSEPKPAGCWNASADERDDHHGSVAEQQPISAKAAPVISGIFRNRWRALLAVDDVVEAVISACDTLGLLESTYFFFTSDHGFSLGEFSMLMDKRHVYDWHTRIPLLVRGPGVAPGTKMAFPATLVDLAPTFLSIAGASSVELDQLDGKSLLPLLLSDRSLEEDGAQQEQEQEEGAELQEGQLGAPVLRFLHSVGNVTGYRSTWRDAVLLEHFYVSRNVKCVRNCSFSSATLGVVGSFPASDLHCTDLRHRKVCWGTLEYPEAQPWCTQDCYPTESEANNFIGIRLLSSADTPHGNMLYAEFQTGNQDQSDLQFDSPSFVEMYDAHADPWMLHNLRDATSPETEQSRRILRERLREWVRCAGRSCP